MQVNPSEHADLLTDFLQFMHDIGAPPEKTSDIRYTGDRIGRYAVAGEKRGRMSGAYQFSVSGDRGIGWVRDHRQGVTHIYRPKMGRKLTDLERRVIAEEMEKRRRAKEKALHNLWIKRAREIRDEYESYPMAGRSHDYLVRKKILPHGIRQSDKCLVVPLYSMKHHRIWNMQKIWPDGTKRYAPEARVIGCFHSIGHQPEMPRIVVTEGFATGASIHEQTGLPVYCAMQANNLGHVAESLRHRHGKSEIIIAADNDQWSKKPDGTPFNAGLHYAREAAALVRGKLILPDVPYYDPARRTDFNDLAVSGLDLRTIFLP